MYRAMTSSEKKLYLDYRNKVCDTEYFNKIKPVLDQIPESNGCKYYNKINKNIGIVADEFLFNSYKDAANFIYITPQNYKQYIDKLDLFLVVTTWVGLNGEWTGIANSTKLRTKLFNIIKEYKNNGITTVFYSKEDPVNYDLFKELALKCEYIFTTCEEVVSKYIKYSKNKNVDVLKFCINPMYHNPIGFRKFNRKDKIIFSGSWYERFRERTKDMNMILEGVLDSKLDLIIVDRNYEKHIATTFFPKKYLPNIVPSISHEYLQKTHKLFDWAINFNSVKDSNTMFANRIYELQALGNILISNYSIGVKNNFPNVFIINQKNEVANIVNEFNDEEIYQYQVQGIRNMMSKENAFIRINYLLNKVNIENEIPKRKVLVVCDEINDYMQKIFDSQSYKDKDLILESDFNEKIKNNYDIIAFFGSKKYYGMYYLEDMINAFKYTNSKYITRDSFYSKNNLNKGIEHDYVSIIKDKYKTIFWSSDFEYKQLIELKYNTRIDGGYSIDHFEFNDSID